MEMVGEARLEAPRQLVWDALNDPQVLKASIPGCEALDKTSETEFTATVISKVGPIKARFGGKVTLSDIQAPTSYTLTGEGQGGMAGFAKADINVSLEALAEDVTLLRYGVNANVGGKLAQLGARLIDATARKSADEFFEKFGGEVRRLVADAPEATSPRGQSSALFDSPVVPAPTGMALPIVAPAGEARTPPQLHRPAAVSTATVMPLDVVKVWIGDQIKIWIADQVAVVTLNRPKSRNAMTLAMWQAMPSIFAALEHDPQVRAIILTGAGDDFSAGADIAEFEQVRASVQQGTDYEVAVDACCDAIAHVRKPTIAVIKGYCLGGGAHLAMSCDFRYAATSAIFGIPAARLSIIYGVKGTQKLLSLVGLPQSKKILYGAQRFDAAEALRIGFVDHVSGLRSEETVGWWRRLTGANGKAANTPGGDPMADARAFARSVVGNAPLSIVGAKAILNGIADGRGALDSDAAEQLIAAAVNSHDYREGRVAFAAKRTPAFEGR